MAETATEERCEIELKALILTGGNCAADVRIPDYDICIAADCGIELSDRLGIVPDLSVGDFDSADTKRHAPKGEVIRHPAHKNQTDTMLAVDLAVERGCDNLYILGGLGGREDHSISNIFFIEALAERGVRATMCDGDNEIRVLTSGESAEIPFGEYKYFSLFALESCVVTAERCEYPLERATLVRCDPYAVSNEPHSDAARVICHSGNLLLVRSERLR